MGATECNFWCELASHFDFSQPITISDIIGLFAMIAAVVAAIVAVCGNRQAQKASKTTEEQFQKNMREQNRAINVSLFDMRSEMLIDVKQKIFCFDRTRAKMLFNDTITHLIQEYDIESKEAKRNELLQNEFKDTMLQMLIDDGQINAAEEFSSKIEAFERMNAEDVTGPYYEQIRESIRGETLRAKWLWGISPEEDETVNYIDAGEESCRHSAKAESIREELQEKMEQFIETSIQ